MRVFVGGAVVALLALAALPATPARSAAQEGEFRALWADAFHPGFKSRAEIDALVESAVRGSLNAIVAQVRRRGDSYYLNSLEPAPDDGFESGLDPLAYLIERAHAAGIEVHAWVIVGAIYSGHPNVPTATYPCRVPCDASHAFRKHGNLAQGDEYWLTRTHPSFTGGTHAAFPGVRLADGNWWIDPGHPGAADHTVEVLKHLVRSYDVDGLHLDRIRYPEMPTVRPAPGGPAGYSTGYNPVNVRRFNEAHGRAAGSLPFPWDSEWNQWRREQLTALVRRVYLESVALEPGLKVSAATITFFRAPGQLGGFQNTEAFFRVYQDWDGWVRQGLLDINMPMVYKQEHNVETRTQFDQWIEFMKTSQYGRHGVVGIAAYLNSLESTIRQLERTRAPAANGALATGQIFYSYDQTNAAIPGVPLRPSGELYRALTEDAAYNLAAPYRTPVPTPVMPWKAQPRKGHLLARVLDADGAAVDGAEVVIQKVGGGPRDASVQQHTDGSGYVGAADLHPGAYQLAITTPDGSELHTVPEPVAPGRVTRLAVRLGSRPRGPMIRAGRIVADADGIGDEDISALELWRGREPLAEDIAAEAAGDVANAATAATDRLLPSASLASASPAAPAKLSVRQFVPPADAPAGLRAAVAASAGATPATSAAQLRERGITGAVIEVPRAGARLRITIYDLRGRRVREVRAEAVEAGSHEFAWDGLDDSGRKAAPGVYLLSASDGSATVTTKLVVVR